MNETEKTVSYIQKKVPEEIKILQGRLRQQPAIIFPLAQKNGGKGYYLQFFTLALGPELFTTLSMGDLVREAQKKIAEGERKELKKTLGEAAVIELSSPTQSLLSDSTVFGLLEEAIKKTPPEKTIIIDGLPRTGAQAERLLSFVDERKRANQPVFFLYFETPFEVRQIRLESRRVCPSCNLNKNIISGLTSKIIYKNDEFVLVCDRCGAKMQRKEWAKGKNDEMTAELWERERLYDEMIGFLKRTAPADFIEIKTAIPAGADIPVREVNPSYALSFVRGKVIRRKGLQKIKHEETELLVLSPEGIVPEVIWRIVKERNPSRV